MWSASTPPPPPRPASPICFIALFYLNKKRKKEKGSKTDQSEGLNSEAELSFLQHSVFSVSSTHQVPPPPPPPPPVIFSTCFGVSSPEGGSDSNPWHAWQGCSCTLHLQRKKKKHATCVFACSMKPFFFFFFHTSNPLLHTWLLPFSFPAVSTFPSFSFFFSPFSSSHTSTEQTE